MALRAERDGDWCSIGSLRVPEEDWEDTFGEEIPLPDKPISLRITPPNGKRLAATVVDTLGFSKVVISSKSSIFFRVPRVSLMAWNEMVPQRYRLNRIGDKTEFWLTKA